MPRTKAVLTRGGDFGQRFAGGVEDVPGGPWPEAAGAAADRARAPQIHHVHRLKGQPDTEG